MIYKELNLTKYHKSKMIKEILLFNVIPHLTRGPLNIFTELYLKDASDSLAVVFHLTSSSINFVLKFIFTNKFQYCFWNSIFTNKIQYVISVITFDNFTRIDLASCFLHKVDIYTFITNFIPGWQPWQLLPSSNEKLT